MKKAVLIDPRLPPKEIIMDQSYDQSALIGCEIPEFFCPSYLNLFAGRSITHFNKTSNTGSYFGSSLSLVCDSTYFANGGEINKICSDLYSAARVEPWPILGPAIVEDCDLEQLKIIVEYIPIYLASEPRIKEKHKQIILSRDASAYNVVLQEIKANPEFCVNGAWVNG